MSRIPGVRSVAAAADESGVNPEESLSSTLAAMRCPQTMR